MISRIPSAKSPLRRLAHNACADDSAATAAITLVLMLVLLGFVSLVVDAGVLFVNRTEMQKAVDAAAIAGAYDYTIGSSGSCSQTNNVNDAVSYATSNHVLSTEVVHNGPPSSAPNLGSGIYCFWQVTAQRTDVPLVFAPLVGHTSLGTVETTAIAYKSPVAGVSNPVPYALWGGNTDNYAPDSNTQANYYDIGDADGGLNQNGTPVVFKQNKWDGVVYPNCGGPTPGCNGNWLVGPTNGFKGYLHINNAPNVFYSIGDTVDSNSGNANATTLCQMAQAGQPGAILVADPACDGSMGCPGMTPPPSGQIAFYVTAIRAVWLNQSQACASGVGGDLGGTICLPSSDARCVVSGGKGGGNDPNAPDVVKLAL